MDLPLSESGYHRESSSNMSSFIKYFFCSLLAAWFLIGCHPGSDLPTNHADGLPPALPDSFISLMNAGKNYLEQGNTEEAFAVYSEAVKMMPHHPDVHLNLANVHLLQGASEEALKEVEEVLSIEPNSAAAYFIQGSAYLRMLNPQEAIKAFENSLKIDPGVTSAFFQLGMAHMGLNQWDEAITAFKEGLRLDPNRLHSSAHYLLAQCLIRVGKTEEAERELELHQANVVGDGPRMGAATFEKCRHTLARVPFRLDQPKKEGIPMTFVEDTQAVFGDPSAQYSGPIGILHSGRNGWSGLMLFESGAGLRVLENKGGYFKATGSNFPAIQASDVTKILVGDFQNDRHDDTVVLGKRGSFLLRFGERGVVTDVTPNSGLHTLKASDGILMDLDFTGKLDLVVIGSQSKDLQIFRQSEPLLFNRMANVDYNFPALGSLRSVTMEDWNRDQVMDLLVSREKGPPVLLEKQRAVGFSIKKPDHWASGEVFCSGDFNNDLRPDLAIMGQEKMVICFHGGEQIEIKMDDLSRYHTLKAIDFDQDGWLDLCAVGSGVKAWRNRGLLGFHDWTTRLGMDDLSNTEISEIHFADFDQDCDRDLVVSLQVGGIRYFRNDGGNANGLVKVNMVGNRSNASGIGCKIEIQTGGLQLTRTVHQLPVEVGIGEHQTLDSFLVHWFNWAQGSAEVPFNCQEPLLAYELTIQEGSCPYLYAWDGNKFRFITDFLGAAPLGLPVAAGKYIEADPEEIVWIGDEESFLAKDGKFDIRITEELREVLYLDEAKLIVVDRSATSEVHSTDKLLPAGPFPPGQILTLNREHSLKRAEDGEGKDVTALLSAVDGKRVSPPNLRSPQLRGFAELHHWTFDFGPIDEQLPLVLVMNGWIRFGGGMANIAASMDPTLPFPFPTLEAEVSPDVWEPVNVTVGAPAGKTKTTLVDLEGKLPEGTSRLRLSCAFEIHWDRIALMEKKTNPSTRITKVAPSEAQLRFRGFSRVLDLPADWPITPDYEQVVADSCWTLTPSGWCTRYGDVSALIAERDEGLCMINSGDELILRFDSNTLPPKSPGMVREYFLYADGWDKDSDFHVMAGASIEPLPFHGMDDQQYGKVSRPSFPSDALHEEYNTRWIEGRGLKRTFSNLPSAVFQSTRSN